MELYSIDHTVEISTPLFSTEDEKKVLQCISRVFPDVRWEVSDDQIYGETDDLERFKEILRDMKIRDAAKSYLTRKIEGDTCEFKLSKQATCNAKINFSEEKQPLGPVNVKIQSEDIEVLIDRLTSREVKE